MTVKELIACLEELPPDERVFFDDGEAIEPILHVVLDEREVCEWDGHQIREARYKGVMLKDSVIAD